MSLLPGRVDFQVWEEDRPVDRATLLERGAEAEGLLTMLSDRVDEELLDHCPGLRVVSNYAVGFDNIDVPAATKRGVLVTNTPHVLTEATADLAFTLLLASARRVVESNAYLRSGDWITWKPDLLLGRDVFGATIGIVGMGKIGQAVAKRAKGFSMNILYYNSSPRPEIEAELGARKVTFDKLLRESDFVTVHLPLTTETKGLFDEKTFRAMKRTAIFVNTARGAIVDQQALYRACEQGWIHGAGLDVFEKEPIPLDDPLLTLPNVTTLPHIGSATKNSREGMAKRAAENLIAALEGKRPLDLVNPEALR